MFCFWIPLLNLISSCNIHKNNLRHISILEGSWLLLVRQIPSKTGILPSCFNTVNPRLLPDTKYWEINISTKMKYPAFLHWRKYIHIYIFFFFYRKQKYKQVIRSWYTFIKEYTFRWTLSNYQAFNRVVETLHQRHTDLSTPRIQNRRDIFRIVQKSAMRNGNGYRCLEAQTIRVELNPKSWIDLVISCLHIFWDICDDRNGDELCLPWWQCIGRHHCGDVKRVELKACIRVCYCHHMRHDTWQDEIVGNPVT